MPSTLSRTRKLLAVLMALNVLLVACSNDSNPGGDDPDNGSTTTQPGSVTTQPGSVTPGPSTTMPQTTTTTLPEDNPLVQAELIVEVDGATIVFDQRPFTLLDGSGRVTVLDPSGNTLAEGPFEGPGSIMTQLADGSFEFVDALGTVVARMSQEQLNDALARALDGN